MRKNMKNPPTAHTELDHLNEEELITRTQNGDSIKDIASHLNRSEGTVKSHLYNAHQKLQEILRPYLQNELPTMKKITSSNSD